MEETHYLREFICCCWLFHHSSSRNKTWDGCYYDWWAPWWGSTPSHVFKVTFGQLCPEAALACGWWGVHGAFPSIWDSFLDHLEGNKPHCLQWGFFSVGFFSTWVFWIHSFFFCWKWKLSCIIARSSQSLQCWGQPKLKHELPLQAHPGDNHPKVDWKQSPVQTLELQSLSSALKGFWRDVRRHLPAPPAPGSSAACRGCLAPQGTSPSPPTASESGGLLLPSSPRGHWGCSNMLCSTVVSRLATSGEVLQPQDKSHALNNSCCSQSSTHRL